MLTEVEVFDPSLFHTHNHCRINFKNGYLTAYRYENRNLFYEKLNHTDLALRLTCGVTPTAIGYFHSAIHNYVVLQRNQGEKTILHLPQLDDMHPGIRGNQSWEDPRIFVHDASQRIFLTGTVLSPTRVRIAMCELDSTTLKYKPGTGHVLGTDEELGQDAEFSQKNWCLFNDRNGAAHILTHAVPWSVFKIDLDSGRLSERTQLDTTTFFQSELESELSVRCSSGMIRWSPSTLVTVLHVRDIEVDGIAPTYRSIFVEFEDVSPFRMVRKTRIIQFMPENHRVEFVSGLCTMGADKILVSLGIDDVMGASIILHRTDLTFH